MVLITVLCNFLEDKIGICLTFSPKIPTEAIFRHKNPDYYYLYDLNLKVIYIFDKLLYPFLS